MGMMHIRREQVSLAALISGSTAIALVHPADPPYVLEDVTTGGGDGPPDVPRPPSVTYRLAWDRLVVDEWLKPPFGGPQDVVEIASPSNESAHRDAHDRVKGMFGHVHHVVFEHVLDGPAEWRWSGEGPRIVFLGGQAPRYASPYGGLSLAPSARDAVVAALPKPPPPRRRWFGLFGLVLAGVLTAGMGRCGGPAEEEPLSFGHFSGWDAFVNASWRGDQEKAGRIALDMTGGAEADETEGPAADAVTTVNGALGLAAVAQGREELIQSVAVAARGCGQCHAAKAAQPKSRTCDHASAALCLVDVVVWSSAGPAIVPGGPNTDLTAEWIAPITAEPPRTDAEARAERALLSCTRCHEKPP